MTNDADAVTRVAEDYYDSADADTFYHEIWGGEDIHIGLYEDGDTIAEASRKTVAYMASRLNGLGLDAKVLDLGAGFGGAARYLASVHGADVTCVNLSGVENARNREMSAAQGLAHKINVIHGAFESVPEPDASYDIVWSQDAFLHSGDREKVLSEAARVLKPGGELIFTDPMQIDDLADPAQLKPIYDRIHLEDLATPGFYRATLEALGLVTIEVELMTEQLSNHYRRVHDELKSRRAELEGRISADYVDRMLAGLNHWVTAGQADLLAWGVLHFRKPAA